MDSKIFTPEMTGKLIEVKNGVPNVRIAFLPNPLPPKWEWPADLWPLLVEAKCALASLDGTGKHLPNPEILLQPLQRREAQLSSKLEGTITDPPQQVLFEAAPRYPTSANDPMNAYREVFNYRRALRSRLDGENDLPLSLRLIKELHRVLMDGVRGSDQTPGEFRTMQNQIGRPARYVPPPPGRLHETLNEFEAYMHSADQFNPLVRAFLAQYQFEAIHPFRDGNGRVGRLLLSFMIAEWCHLSSQWLYMSAFFEKRKDDYIDLLLNVSTKGGWEPWIRFCLEGVISQSVDTEKRCEKLLALHRDFHDRLKAGSVRLSNLVDRLFKSPVIGVTQYSKEVKISYPTARSDLRKLAELGILQNLDMDPITYYCSPIYSVTFEDIEVT